MSRVFFLLAVVGFLLTGCQASGPNPLHQVQSYSNPCSASSFPREPSCIGILLTYDFDSRTEFQACRQSVSAYERAINTFIGCKSDELKTVFDDKITEVKLTYNCFVDYFSDNERGDPSEKCALVEEPNFFGRHEADGIEMYFGIPSCVRKSKTAFYIPKSDYDLDKCKEDVAVFMGSGSYRLGSRSVSSLLDGATSAQKQYDAFMSGLQRKGADKRSDAIRKFNCKAQGGRICY